MNRQDDRASWEAADYELEREFVDVITQLVAANEPIEPSPLLDRKVLQMARERSASASTLQTNWLLGQGPWVILVTAILFAVAMLFLM